jgi:predicted ATPase
LSVLDLLRIPPAHKDFRKAIFEMGGMDALIWDGQANEIRLALRTGAPRPYELVLRQLRGSGDFEFEDTWSPGVGTAMTMTGRTEIAVELAELRGFLSAWSIHQDIRSDQDCELRRPSITRQERFVDSDGQNLTAVLHTLYENDRDFEKFLDKAMSAAFPGDYEKLVFPPEADGRTQLRVRRKHRKRADSSADLSDGTLRFLLLMTILGSPDPAPLIAIDEPETGLHPRMMAIVAEVAENAARKSQIIFSTHSPSFLDAFDDEPPTTTIVTMEGSETVLKTITGDELKRWIEDYSLSKFVFSGEADAVL